METPLWVRFIALCRGVRAAHIVDQLEKTDHDFDHALRVGLMAAHVLPDYEGPEGQRLRELAFIAGICHNADRVVQCRRRLGRYVDAPDEPVHDLCADWLSFVPDLTEREHLTIIDAVLKHGGANDPADHLLLTALRDADRLVNAEADVIMRAGKQPVRSVDVNHLLSDPEATYRNPKSVLFDLDYMSRRWDSRHPDHDPKYCLQLPKAIEIGEELFAYLRDYVRRVLASRERAGLVPYPDFN